MQLDDPDATLPLEELIRRWRYWKRSIVDGRLCYFLWIPRGEHSQKRTSTNSTRTATESAPSFTDYPTPRNASYLLIPFKTGSGVYCLYGPS